MIITIQVLSIVSSLSVKNIQSELWTNKQPSLKWRVSCVFQNGDKLRHSSSISFDVKTRKKRWERD